MERRRSERPAGAIIAALLVAGSVVAGATAASAQDVDDAGAGGAIPPAPLELDEVVAPQPLVVEAQPGEDAPIPELVDAVDDGDADPTDLRGAEAVAVLEQNDLLDEVADNAGLSEDELVEELVEDPTVFVAVTGEVGYVEMFAPHGDDHDHDHGGGEHLEHGADDHDGTLGELQTLSGTVFDLESNPAASSVLYLDFTGHTTTSPTWTAQTGLTQIISAPFDRDGNPSSFSAAEQLEILEIWEWVSEDYVPFDVNVTTRSDLDATVVDQRIVITPSNFLTPFVPNASQILGVAILSSFRNGPETPAFAFTGQSFSRAAIVAETVSHEAGHTFGLRHDGRLADAGAGDEYYFGHNGWAPIMGNPVGSEVSQWSRGQYRCATRPTEDDIAMIASRIAQRTATGNGYRPDDQTSWVSSAPIVELGGSATGIIGGPAFLDEDVFRTGVVPPGPLTVTVRPLGPSPNLHPRLTLKSSGLTQVVAEPDTPAGEAVASLTSAGGVIYSIHVQPAAWIGPVSGFSSYGSMGYYQVEVEAVFTPRTFTLSGGADSLAPARRINRPPVC